MKHWYTGDFIQTDGKRLIYENFYLLEKVNILLKWKSPKLWCLSVFMKKTRTRCTTPQFAGA